MNDVVQSLLRTPIGKELTPPEATALVSAGEVKTVRAGAMLFRAGSPADTVFFVLEGNLQVLLGVAPNSVVVATLGPGQLVGELELMTRSQRVATLLAVEETKVLALPSARLEKMLAGNEAVANKLVLAIARALARRLAAVNQRIIGKEKPAAPAVTRTPAPGPVEVSDADVMPVDDDDLAVLDKLWS
jgi:CRP-like cAMP-binding protein